mgnify:CR=1 FL=1
MHDNLTMAAELCTDMRYMVRLHQKINPERWYYHADRTGVVVLQDISHSICNGRAHED